MGKPIAVLLSTTVLAALAATGASAMPITPATPTLNVEQVRWVCNEIGRCWHQRDYYRPYGYYRRHGDDDEWRERYRYRNSYGYYGPRWGGYGWRRGWEDDNEQ